MIQTSTSNLERCITLLLDHIKVCKPRFLFFILNYIWNYRAAFVKIHNSGGGGGKDTSI